MLGSKKPLRCVDRVTQYHSLWDIGASGAHTKTSGFPNTGFSGVARTAAGKYTITFSDVEMGGLVCLELVHWHAADTEPKLLAPTLSTYSASAKTVAYEAWDVDETATQIEIPSGDKVSIVATFLDTK
jgi:hypothetical protein